MLTQEQIARIAYEVIRVYSQTFDDLSDPDWENASQSKKDSIISDVSFHVNNPGSGIEALHDKWVKEIEADGWIHGLVKDEQKKEHPSIGPFYKLTKEERTKHYLFRAVVRACIS